MELAHRASYDKKTLARQVIPLAPGYQTALLSCPAVTLNELNCSWFCHIINILLTDLSWLIRAKSSLNKSSVCHFLN